MPNQGKRTAKGQDSRKATPTKQTADGLHHHVEETDRPDTPELEGGTPLPEELTGRASGTDEDLTSLFNDDSPAHLADGFRGGSDDEPPPARPARSRGVRKK